MNKVFFVLSLLGLPSFSFAAQLGKVIVDEASVYRYPRQGTEVISSLSRDQSLAVSNLPTEGFYKVRLPNGELGWVSGNDIFVGAKPAVSEPAASEPVAATKPTPEPRPATQEITKLKKKKKMKEPSDDLPEDNGYGDDSRILVMIGQQFPSYGGLKQYYDVAGLSPGSSLVLEAQFRVAKHLHWAARGEFNFSSVGAKSISATETQELKQSSIPLLIGLNLSPWTSKEFRLGIGAYAGLTLFSNVVINQTTSSLDQQLSYSSYDPTAMLAVQGAWGFGNYIGVVGELGYRYQKSGNQKSTTLFGGKPAFQLDSSGVVFHVGLEFKF